MRNEQIYNSILDVVGQTPVVRLNRLPKLYGVECEVLVKCEFLNPTGSHKDRTAMNLIAQAEKDGILKPGGTVIEATSGNTGLSLSFVAAMKGYKAIMCAVPKISLEKFELMKGFGADVVKARTNASKGPDGVFSMAEKLTESIPGAVYMSQFSNKANPDAHYKTTSVEILKQTGGKLDYFFMAAGTGGTITGNGRHLKEALPDIKVIGCDPIGSLIGTPDGVYAPFKVEGVGYDFVPKNVDKKLIDEWIKFGDKPAFDMARMIAKEEGMMVGGSAAGILWCALEYAKSHKLGKDVRILAVLPDTNRNYLTKQGSKEWLLEFGFVDEKTYRFLSMEDTLFPEKRFGDNLMLKDLGGKPLRVVKLDSKISDVWELVQSEKKLLVNKTGVAKDADYKGILTAKEVLSAISSEKFTMDDIVEKIMKTEFPFLNEDLKASTIGKVLEARDYVLYKQTGTNQIFMVTEMDIMKKMTDLKKAK